MAAEQNRTVSRILRGLRSRYPVFYLVGWDESRIESLLRSVARSYFGADDRLRVWSAASGFGAHEDPAHPARDPMAAIARVAAAPPEPPLMYLFKDLPPWFEESPALVRGVRDLYYQLKNGRTVLFMSCPLLRMPEMLKKEIFLVDVDLPSEEEIVSLLQADPATAEQPAEELFQLAARMRGLSMNEAGHLAARLFHGTPLTGAEMLAEVQEEKAQMLRKESCLKFYPSNLSLDQIGGLENLKQWVNTRAGLFARAAYDAGVPLPAGILFMGVSGCGKSMAAKAIAAAWSLPLVRLDMSLVLSGSFGTPEYAFERATQMAEELAPMVLWVDELENAFGLDPSAGQSGGNVNIFSSFLTWLQEKSPKVFVAATANRIQQLPAELMRKGRFDQLFFLDLPNQDERREILRIHILRNGGDPDQFDLGYLAVTTKDWSGAEIEQAIKSARVDAYRDNRPFAQADVVRNAIATVPLSQTMVEQIREIKNWSFRRAVNASRPEAKTGR